MFLFKSCGELGGIRVSMIYGKDGILVQNCCIVLKFSPLCPFPLLRQDHSALSPTGQKLLWDPSVLLSSDEAHSLGDVVYTGYKHLRDFISQ